MVEAGNSVAGLALLEMISRELDLDILVDYRMKLAT